MLSLARLFGLAPGSPSISVNGHTNTETDADTDTREAETTGPASDSSTTAARLPPELWLQILSLACSVPGELNSNATSLFERPVHLDAYRAREKLLPTRHSLPLVCRSFYNLATPLLYGSISLNRRRLFNLLLATMQESSQVDAQDQATTTTTRSHGWWTRRLDLDLRRIGRWRGFKVADLLALLLHMPNLEILVVLPWNAFFPPMAKVLHPCKNLKLVSLPSGEWLSYKDSNNNDSDGMVSTTTATTSLPYYARLRECIPTNKSRISEVYKYNIHLHLAESNNRYPDIRGILAIDPWLAYHTAKDPSYFPRLCTLYVSQNVNQDFITTHGFKITTVDLMDTQWSHFTPYLKHFPNLRTVILDVKPFYQDRIWGPTPSSSLVCATVRDIGLTRKRIMSLKPYYNLIFKELLVIFPNAVRIRILDFPFVEVMAQQLRKSCPWYRTLAIKKIRLEREDGSLFW